MKGAIYWRQVTADLLNLTQGRAAFLRKKIMQQCTPMLEIGTLEQGVFILAQMILGRFLLLHIHHQ
ncbi:MAG: hypothetical protein WCK80_04270, partial [bacterium]